MTYHEIDNTRRYEYRLDEGAGFSGWIDAGPASRETLAAILAGINSTDAVEVRQICQLADTTGQYAGALMFATLVHRFEPD